MAATLTQRSVAWFGSNLNSSLKSKPKRVLWKPRASNHFRFLSANINDKRTEREEERKERERKIKREEGRKEIIQSFFSGRRREA